MGKVKVIDNGPNLNVLITLANGRKIFKEPHDRISAFKDFSCHVSEASTLHLLPKA